MKKNLLLVTASLVALSFAAPAGAADLAARPYTKAPPMVSAIYDWSGVYVGINGGGAWNRFGTEESHIDADGGTVGGQIGYRWQASNWVFGVEAQGNWADLSGSRVLDLGAGVTETDRARTDAFGLFTGQVGYAWSNVLLYVKGGAAIVSNKYDVRGDLVGFGNLGSLSGSETRWGGTVGVGLDYGFAPNWSVGVEWDHIFLSGHTANLNGFDFAGDPMTGTIRTSQDVDMVLARLNYKFGGPVVAKY